MRIRLLTRRATPTSNHPPGSILDLPLEEARVLINLKYALPLDGEDYETATIPVPEVAAKRRRAKK